MAITEKELLDMKKQVSDTRDNIIKAKATMQEVEKTMLGAAKDLAALGIEVVFPASEDPAIWDQFYTQLIADTVTKIAAVEAEMSEKTLAIKSRIAAWQK